MAVVLFRLDPQNRAFWIQRQELGQFQSFHFLFEYNADFRPNFRFFKFYHAVARLSSCFLMLCGSDDTENCLRRCPFAPKCSQLRLAKKLRKTISFKLGAKEAIFLKNEYCRFLHKIIWTQCKTWKNLTFYTYVEQKSERPKIRARVQ